MNGSRLESFDERDETPALEVRVYRHGVLARRELCESEEQAALVVDAWSELDGVECEVDDLATRDRTGDSLEPEPAEFRDDEYPESPGLEAARHRYE